MKINIYCNPSFRLRSLVGAAAGLFIVACAPIKHQAPRMPLMGMPTITGLAQVRDQVTGSEYFAPCSPCAGPTPKTPAQESLTTQEMAGAIGNAVAAAMAPTATSRPPAPGERAAQAKLVVHFPSSAAKPDPADLKALLGALPLTKSVSLIEVRGFADSTGSASLNERLSVARAQAIVARLIANGVPRAKIEITHCATCFAATNDTEEGRRANRRAEVDFVMTKEPVATSAKRG
jgi:outer membrane protein OmpA-like peptidoglycan-associated protein